MNKSFKGEYISFLVRLSKRLAPVILLLICALFKIYYSHSFSGIRTPFLIFLIICFLIGIYYHTNKIRTVVNEIRFTDKKLQIIGQDFNSKFEDNLDVSKTMLEIQEEDLGKNRTRYCLEIYSDNKYYYLNKFNDWKYDTLVEIIDEYKLKTGKTVAGMEFYSALTSS